MRSNAANEASTVLEDLTGLFALSDFKRSRRCASTSALSGAIGSVVAILKDSLGLSCPTVGQRGDQPAMHPGVSPPCLPNITPSPPNFIGHAGARNPITIGTS